MPDRLPQWERQVMSASVYAERDMKTLPPGASNWVFRLKLIITVWIDGVIRPRSDLGKRRIEIPSVRMYWDVGVRTVGHIGFIGPTCEI